MAGSTIKVQVILSLMVLLSACSDPAPARSQGQPLRVISTAPSITEIIFALEADDYLVGVTSYCDFPPEAGTKPVIGDFASPNIEPILDQNPDLIMLLSGRSDLEEKFRTFSIPTLVLKHETIEEIYASILLVGKQLGRREKAESLVADLKRNLEKTRRLLDSLPTKRVLFLVGRNPGSLTDIYAVGNAGYIGQLIETAGGRNVFAETGIPYPKVSIEEILTANPEVILDLSHGENLSDAEVKSIKDLWRRFPRIEAVRTDQVYPVDSDIYLVPGPRLDQAVGRLAELIHGVEID